ncbi:inhibitor of Bruton tyrosine kinase isoform X2 [Cylas formicarius]|uniref:inhibitor of Bruton tyrosine kinase isoform X2 n=1 Tax=Cylas formicarius TaxID=197179 RepID=UPI0029587E0C|nr:inhibitor of Bruton tyrosine kinase isoform X2 [Cylas formicarius]
MAQISKTSHIPDCTNKCHSTIHGDIITSAVTKKAVRDQDLCVYLNYVCCCCESVRDTQGRTALHVAASCGRVNLLQWLVQKRLANVNTRDVESGYTPLHRSIFYGKLETAVQLLKMGANATIQDADGLTFIEHAMLDGPSPDKSDSGEVYTWGTNCNNALGPQQSRNVPDILDVFHKKYPNEFVKQICLSQFHSVIVTVSGKCYSCGHGQGGRLGLGIQHTEVTPKRINFPDKSQSDFVCVQASISRDHSLFLTIDGNIYACGSNKHYVLGISPPPDQLLVPKQLKSLPIHLKGVDVGYYHSLAWGPKGLYTWGLNGGQLGHQLNNKNDDKFIFTPKLVKVFNYNEISLKLVCCSNGATIVYTKKGDLYALHEYQCKKIASRQLNLVQISSVGGKLNCTLDSTLSSKENRGLKVAALTNAGNLLIWQESDQTLLRCVFSVNRALVLKQFILNLNEVLFITNNGEGFRGAFKARKKKPTSEEDSSSAKSEFHKFLEKDQCIFVKLQKLPRIHRALNVQSDLKGENYCIIQAHPYKMYEFPDIADSEISKDFLLLMELANPSDNIHDVVFQIDRSRFYVHRYILSSASAYLAKCSSTYDQKPIVLEGYHPDIFQQLLLFIYTKRCDLIVPGELKNLRLRNLYENVPKPAGKVEKMNPVRMLHEMAKRFEVVELQKILSNLDFQHGVIKMKVDNAFRVAPLKFNRLLYPDYYDVNIVCKDGGVIEAHKCVLAARLDYFSNMFSSRWSGENSGKVSFPFSASAVLALLEFLYTDSLSALENRDIDQLFKILIMADQFFVVRLKEECEFLLSNLLSLKNAIQLLRLANAYNAQKLKYCCMNFIVSNIAPFLELRLLDELEQELLQQLSQAYYENNPQLWCRVITPYSTAVSDEEVVMVSVRFPIDLDEESVKMKSKSNSRKRIRSHKVSVSETSLTKPKAHVLNRSGIGVGSLNLDKGEFEDKFTVLSKKTDEINLSSSFTDDNEFPLLELNSPLTSVWYGNKQHKNEKHRMNKVSQKQRKRLSSQNNESEKEKKNPWKMDLTIGSPNNSTLEDNMENIMESEKRQKENLIKIKSKSLALTQLEDKAIEELRSFYNIENTVDEVITIERVSIGVIASPVWVPKIK